MWRDWLTSATGQTRKPISAALLSRIALPADLPRAYYSEQANRSTPIC
jgi:hypothetical protein